MDASLGGHCFGHRYHAAGDGCFLRDFADHPLDSAAVLWSGILDRLFYQRHRHGALAPQIFHCDGIAYGRDVRLRTWVCDFGQADALTWPGVGLVCDVAEAMSLLGLYEARL